MAIGIGFIDKLFTSKDGKGIFTQVLDGAGGIIDKFHMSPEDKLALQAELDKVMEEKRQAAITFYQQDVADTDSARKMNTAIEGTAPSWLAKNVSYIIAIFIMLAWGGISGYLFASMLKWIDNGKIDYAPILAVYTTVTSLATTIIGFYFGSSHGSAEKQATIDRLTSP